MSGTGSLAGGNRIPGGMQTAQTNLGQHNTDRNGFHRQGTVESKANGALQTQPSDRMSFATKNSVQQPPQMLAQPNHAMQHYATSGQASNQPHIVKIKRPSSRDPLSSFPGGRSSSTQGLPQMPA